MSNASPQRLPLKTKVIFGSADLFGGGASNMIGFFYLIFLTDVLRISPALAGVIFLASKAWDAVSDPIMGVLTDRTRSRMGRHRPYFLAAVFTVFTSIVLLWLPVGFASEVARFLYAFFAYILFSTVSTAVMIPYFAMQPRLTADYHERISLNVVKMTFSFLAGILVALIPMQIVNSFDDIRTGYLVMSLVFGAVFALPWLGLFAHLKPYDLDSTASESGISVREFLKPLELRTFRYLIGIYLCAFLTLDVMSSLMSYYMTYVQQRPDELSFILGTLIVSQIAFLPVISALAKRYGKARIFIYCAVVWSLSVFIIGISPKSLPGFVLYIQAVVTGFGVGGCVLLPWTMYPDTTDVGKYALGRDCAGSFSGIMTFFRKLASAVALFLVGTVLEIAGYIKPASGADAGEIARQIQPASALTAIRLLLVIAPFILLVIAGILASRYPLSEAKHRLVVRALGGELNETEDAELRKELI